MNDRFLMGIMHGGLWIEISSDICILKNIVNLGELNIPTLINFD